MITIKFKTTRPEMAALQNITEFHLITYDPVGTSQLLIKEILWEMNDKMETQLRNWEQKKFTLRLTGTQAMAFVAFWMVIDLHQHPYEMVLVNRIIADIHKANLYANTFSGVHPGGAYRPPHASSTSY